MSRRMVVSLAALVLGVVTTAGSSPAGIAMFGQSVKVDHAADTATFTIDFTTPPDFLTLNSGKPVDTFSVEIANNPTGPNPLSRANLTSVVRGDEIHIANSLPIRNANPFITDPVAGGWGTVRGTADSFSVKGDELKFTANLNTLGTPSGNFAYRVSTFHDGAVTGTAQASSVPLPSALLAGMMMLGLGIVLSLGKSYRFARAK